METQLRNATLNDLAALLTEQSAAKRDVVLPADLIRSVEGRLIVPGMHTELTLEGVTATTGTLTPTNVCDESLAYKLGIPLKYLRETRGLALRVPSGGHDDGTPRPLLLDEMLNAHLHAHGKNVLVRAFANEDGTGIARAVLSDRFKPIDNLDCLMSVLDGARHADAEVEVQKIDLSERAMRVHFYAPGITALAPRLLDGYRSPWGGGIERVREVAGGEGMAYAPGGEPIVFAGFVASNSETGGGAFTIVPRLVVKVCKNGMTITRDAVREVHIGGQLETGVVQWSEATMQANLELITRKTTDAVRTFLDVEYMTNVLNDIEGKADRAIERPEEAIKVVATKLRYTEAERETLLSHFIRGGQGTAGGLLNAVTSMAQDVPDPDRSADIEASALEAFAMVAG